MENRIEQYDENNKKLNKLFDLYTLRISEELPEAFNKIWRRSEKAMNDVLDAGRIKACFVLRRTEEDSSPALLVRILNKEGFESFAIDLTEQDGYDPKNRFTQQEIGTLQVMGDETSVLDLEYLQLI